MPYPGQPGKRVKPYITPLRSVMKAYHWRPLLEEREAKKREDAPRAKVPDVVLPSGVKVRGIPICVECTFHRCTFDWMRGKVTHWCYHPESRHPVTGAPTDPSMNRRDKLDCGPYGTRWVAMAAAPKRESVVLELPDTEPEQYLPPVPVRLLSVPPRDELIAVLFERGGT